MTCEDPEEETTTELFSDSDLLNCPADGTLRNLNLDDLPQHASELMQKWAEEDGTGICEETYQRAARVAFRRAILQNLRERQDV